MHRETLKEGRNHTGNDQHVRHVDQKTKNYRHPNQHSSVPVFERMFEWFFLLKIVLNVERFQLRRGQTRRKNITYLSPNIRRTTS